MSWSFQSVGKPSGVKAAAAAEFSKYKCVEPEETLRQGVLEIINKSLSAMPSSVAVQVEAFGSQVSGADSDGKPYFTNSLKLEIKPIYGFVD